MDRRELKERILGWVRKYKYVLLVILLGVFLMLLPEGNHATGETIQPEETQAITSIDTELEQILSQIQGVGKVKVMITEVAGAQTVYQTDTDTTTSGDTISTRVETVVIGSSASQAGLIATVTPPVYLGVLVVCQGGDQPNVKLAIVQAVAAVTGVGTDHISVLKMK